MNIVIPTETCAAAWCREGDDVLIEARPDGLRVRTDSLWKVYVEPTGRCNLQCAMCPRGAWASSASDMLPAHYHALLEGLPTAPLDAMTLAFGGFGEPTLHPDFLLMVARARHAGLRVEIVTNGTTMTEELAEELVRLDVAQIALSLDGGDPQSYLDMRGRPLGPIVEALARLCEVRRRRRARTCVGVACVVTRRNVASMPALLDLARRLSLDFVSISNVVPHTAEMAADALWHHAAQLSNAHPASWRPRVVAGRFDAGEATRPLLDVLLRQVPMVPPPAMDSGEWQNRCRFVRDGVAAVAWDGHVAPCLSLLYTHPEYIGSREKTVLAYTVGHVQSQPMSEIWRGDAYRAFRRRVREFEVSPCLSCGGCAISETNEGDCFGTPFPACSECLWAQGIVLCP